MTAPPRCYIMKEQQLYLNTESISKEDHMAKFTHHLQALTDILGKDRVLKAPVDTFGYSYDGSPEPLSQAFQPDAVCKCHSTEEVSQVMAYCHRHNIPVTCRGIGSGRSGGAIPVSGGVVLSLDEMNAILEIDRANLMATVQAGVRTKTLADACKAEGLFYPPDPSSYAYSTIGGNIAENAGGICAVKYGVTAAYVMALEVVLADGRVIRVGGKMVKNVTGYNLVGLFIGSEGTLGIITQATLRLIAAPACKGTAQACFSSMQAACETVSDALAKGVVPAAAEVMDAVSIQAAERFLDFSAPDNTEALVLFDVDGDNPEAISRQLEALQALAEAHGAVRFLTTTDPDEAAALWQVRRKLSSAVAALAPDKVGEDISVPRSKLAKVVETLNDIAQRHDLLLAVYGHAGDGNLHPAFLLDLADPAQKARLAKALDETFRAAVACGGTLSGEHGIGISKKPWIQTALSEDVINTSLTLKQALDPKGILNPGKIF